MKKTKLLFYLLIVVFSSCKNEAKKDNEITFTRNDFIKKDTLKAEYIDFGKSLLNPSSFNVINDTIILALSKGGEGYFLELYGLKSKQKIVDGIVPKGRGPGEFLSCRVSYQNSESFFTVDDYVSHKMSIYQIDSILKKGASYSPKQIKLPSNASNISQLNRNHFVIYNDMYIENEDFSNNVNEVFLIDISKDSIPSFTATEKQKYFPPNVNGGYILISPNKEAIFVADFHDDNINIYDNQLNQIKSIKGPDQYKIKYRNTKEGLLFNKGEYFRSYYPSYYTNEYLYLVYVGANGISSNMNKLDEKPVEIFKLNWNGDLLHHYQLDEFLINISIDSKEEYVYGTLWSSDGSLPQLVRYNLKH